MSSTSAPPAGEKAEAVPYFFHAASGSWYIQVVSGVCLPIIIIFACIRVYSKLGLKRKLTWDDLSCALGISCGIVFIALSLAGSEGMTQYQRTIELRKRDMNLTQLRTTLVMESLYGPFVWFIKLSLFIIIIQIFSRVRWLKHMAIGGAVFTGLFYFSAMIAYPILCAPRNKEDQQAYIDVLASTRCKGSFTLGIVLGVVNVVSDLYLILIPLPAVWALHLPLRRRIAISSMFLVGLMALAASTVSLVYRVKVSLMQNNVCAFNILPNWLFAIVEMAAGIIVTCMPATLLVFNSCFKPFAISSFAYLRSKSRSFSPLSSAKSSSPTSSSTGGVTSEKSPMTSAASRASYQNFSRPVTYAGNGAVYDGFTKPSGKVTEKALPQVPMPEALKRPESAYAKWMGATHGRGREGSEAWLWDLERISSRGSESDGSSDMVGTRPAGRGDVEEITALPDFDERERERDVQSRQEIWKTSHILVERDGYR